MSDDIPFEIQMEIVKRVFDVKSLIRFRSVSKPWKSLIDSSEFVKGYGARHTQPHSRILGYKVDGKFKYVRLVDDDDQTFKVQELAPSLVSPLLSQYCFLGNGLNVVVGVSHGLLCFLGTRLSQGRVVIWNPCIRKSFGITVRRFPAPVWSDFVFGFGVCPVNTDPTVVKISCGYNHVEVFTLSSGVWNEIPSGNLPRRSIRINRPATQVVIDRFIYWGAHEKTFTGNGGFEINHMVVSFDLITKEFKVVDVPDCFTNEVYPVSVSKLRGSLVVYGSIYVDEARFCSVWVMEPDSSFRKLFTIGQQQGDVYTILGFRKNGEPVHETVYIKGEEDSTLGVYDPCSQQIKNLGISGRNGSFFVGSYKESLLLLDHSDLHIYSE